MSKVASSQSESLKDPQVSTDQKREAPKLQGVLKKTLGYFRKNLFGVFAATSLAGHIFIVSHARVASSDLQQQWDQRNQETAAAIEQSALPENEKKVLQIKHEAVKERNQERVEAIAKNAEEREAFKKKYLDDPHVTPESILEYERIFEGVEPRIIQVAGRNFENIMPSLQREMAPQRPSYANLQKIVKTFRKGPQEDTIAHASDALVLKGLGITSNCNAGHNLYGMPLLRIYPGIENQLKVQQFRDHIRLLYEDPETGIQYIVEREVDVFPDEITGLARSKVMPLLEYWKSVLGVEEKSLKNVQYFGPPPQEYKGLRGANDQINVPEGTISLGDYGGTSAAAVDPEKRKETLKFINDQLKSVAKYGELTLEVERLEETLDRKKAEEMVEKSDFSLLRFYKKIDTEALKLILQDPGFRQKKYHEPSIGFGLENITDEFIEIVKQAGEKELTLRFFNPKILTVENLKKLQKLNLKKISFFNVGALPSTVAKAIAHLNTDILVLTFTETLKKEAARELSQIRAKKLALYGLSSLSVETAQQLGQLELEELTLGDLASLGVQEALQLSTLKAKRVYLDLKTLTPGVAKALAKLRVESLSFDKLESIDAETVLGFRDINIPTLNFYALKNINAESVKAFGATNVKTLNLAALEALDEATAEELAKLELKELMLTGLRSATPQAIRKLAASRAKRINFGGEFITKPGILDALKDAKFDGLAIYNLVSITPGIARNLAQLKVKTLGLMGVKSLPADAAGELQHLSIAELVIYTDTLSMATIKEMVHWKIPKIWLPDMISVTPEMARAMVAWKFEVAAFHGLKASEEIKAILRQNPKILFPS